MPSNQWEQYAAPAGGNKWDQYARDAVPPTSGPIGAKVPEPDMTISPEEQNKYALSEGLKGMAKDLVGTVASANPAMTKGFGPGGDIVNTDSANTDQTAGKIAGAGLEMLAPAGVAEEVLPNAKRAGAVLGSIRDAAEHVPVDLTRSAEHLQRLAELGTRGGTMPRVADQLLNRSQAVGPINFPEARDFYSNLARPSLMERMTTSPEVKGTLGKLKSSFSGDIGDAADSIGLGDKYRDALSEYRNAKRIQKGVGVLGTVGLGYGLKAAGLAGVAHVLGKVAGE